MTSFNFILRPSTKCGRHTGSLSLRIIHDRKVKTVTLPFRLYPDEWDTVRQSVIYPENDSERTIYLKEIETRIETELASLKSITAASEQQGRYNIGDIMDKYYHKQNAGNLLNWSRRLVSELIRKGQYRLAKAYNTVSKGLIKYNLNTDLPLSHINACLIKGFENYLREHGKKPNTISFYMRNLRSLYKKAVAAGHIPTSREDPFAGVYTKVKPATKRALTVDETVKLYEIDFDSLRREHKSAADAEYIENLYFSWRLFMFCFFAQGMSFIDMVYLRKENIRNGVCTYYRRKTKQQVEIELNAGMWQIIESFAHDVKHSLYLFPIITGEGETARRQYESALRTQNRRLKALAKLAAINSKVSTHVSRHTFATITRNSGLPVGAISEMLGHTTEKMTYNYFASFGNTVSQQAYNIISGILLRSAG